MKTKLPETRNRNLPLPHAPQSSDEQPLSQLPRPPLPEREGKGGPSFGRSLLAMLIIGALFGTGIFFYIRNAESDADLGDAIDANLQSAGSEIWSVGRSSWLFA